MTEPTGEDAAGPPNAGPLRLEGRAEHCTYSICRDCAVGKAEYRCRDCLGGGEMLCRGCTVKHHRQLPFHRIQRWNGSYFSRKTLKKLGLRIQLGHWHEQDRVCAAPERAAGDDFVIVDVSGVHEVGLDFCGCGASGSHTIQLLRAQLYPATTSYPRSAATFSVLHRFHLLSFESKCSAYEFYYSLARESDNSGLKPVKDRYHEFLRMTREWRHLEMLKRAGRGHDPEGVAVTKDGELALLCPACPHPGKNLPQNWKDYPPEKQFLFALFLAMDANFRLRRKDVSSETKDPGLGKGWAFFCEVERYMKHVKANWGQVQERSHCVAHDAVDKPDREARGTASSGIGAVDCARHNMKRPNAVGDLQLGERYLNMDYMFFMSVKGTDLIRFFVSYDIACQWHINIWIRMLGYKNDALKIQGERKYMTFLVPKFHLPAHIEACNLRFSFNLTPYVGLTDGEAPERGWANVNPLASSTSEMGPGSRRDTLNDHFNDWNYKKIILLGKMMLQRTLEAVPMMVYTRRALRDLEKSFERETLAAWRKMAEEWEVDGDKPNPFQSVKKDEHLAAVRRDAGIEIVGAVREDMHVTELIAMGLQLEEQQRVLRFDMSATGLHPSDQQRTAMVERTSKLRRKIFAWIDIQKMSFPIVETLRKLEDDARARTAGSQPVPGVKGGRRMGAPRISSCASTACGWGRPTRLCTTVRRHLLLKDRFSRGVRANTRSKTKIEIVDERIRRAAAQYRDAWEALGVLGPKVARREWQGTLKELRPDDVRGMPKSEQGDAVRQAGGTEKASVAVRALQAAREGVLPATQGVPTAPGRKKKRKVVRPISWIWIAQRQGRKAGEPEQQDEALRIKWAKTRARAMQWSEEVDLLEEEMRRAQQFLTSQAGWWGQQVGSRGLPDGPQAEGETAYALRQSTLKAKLCAKFAATWAGAKVTELIRSGRGGEARTDSDDDEEEEGGAEDEALLSEDEEEPVREVRRPVADATSETNEGFT
ncbi:hypothetical protein DFH09DRAFT_1260865 [Mycena vulgaris]|nr:hypothetical protein DFH09DRAFT_1260865 [Mycena vulgaris]